MVADTAAWDGTAAQVKAAGVTISDQELSWPVSPRFVGHLHGPVALGAPAVEARELADRVGAEAGMPKVLQMGELKAGSQAPV